MKRMNTCGVDGCDGKLGTNNRSGFCRAHRRSSDRRWRDTEKRSCSTDGCDSILAKYNVYGLCRKHAQGDYYLRNRDRLQQAQRDRNRVNHLNYKYGLTLEDFDVMVEAQSGVCAICGSLRGHPEGAPLFVDHCHTTGSIRDLLCRACNVGLGAFADDSDLLCSAIRYLERHRVDL